LEEVATLSATEKKLKGEKTMSNVMKGERHRKNAENGLKVLFFTAVFCVFFVVMLIFFPDFKITSLVLAIIMGLTAICAGIYTNAQYEKWIAAKKLDYNIERNGVELEADVSFNEAD